MRIKISILLLAIASVVLLDSCDSTDSFAPAGNRTLTFKEEEIDLGTIFSGMPSATRDFWVYNNTSDGIICSEIRLAQGNQTGFRVNVDGWYLGPESGYRLQDVRIAKGDSIRIFVEITSYSSGQQEPRQISDDLLFTLQGGGTQRLRLNASSIDAIEFPNYDIQTNTTFASSQPVLVKKSITVAGGATLTIAAGTTLYFANDAGIDIYGTLLCEGTASENVVLRGDRIDNMFDYLPYDRVAGQWQGLHFYESSANSHLTFTDIHSTYNGIVVDKPANEGQHLTCEQVTIHNCQGYGLISHGATIDIVNTEITNTLNDCLLIDGGSALVKASTLGQFYPFDGNRGAALRFTNENDELSQLLCDNSLITGYAEDVVMGNRADNGKAFNYHFSNCLLRTEEPAESEQINFVGCTFENHEAEEQGGQYNFALFDTKNLEYDFSLAENSQAIGLANSATMPSIDRKGNSRDENPDVGAYEYVKE